MIESYITGDSYKEDICFSIVLLGNWSNTNRFAYQLGFNTSGNRQDSTEFDDVPDPLEPATIEYMKEDMDYAYTKWVKNGFLTLQHWIGKSNIFIYIYI